jgi:hypothetical protein
MIWISLKTQYPKVGEEVNTCIKDDKGIRNEQSLIFKSNLWFTSDSKMYVYYNPTHWSPIK